MAIRSDVRKPMTKVVVDRATSRKLIDMRQPIELCDDAGNVLGHFIPVLLASECGIGPEVEEDELDRRERAGGGRPLSEILADLGE